MNTLLVIQKQRPADKAWNDEQGNAIPYNRTTAYERHAEADLYTLAKQAADINSRLTNFKTLVRDTVQKLYAEFIKSNDGKVQGKGKGNITLYNFDRSIKMEVNVNEPIHFDEEYIKLAQAELFDIFAEELAETDVWLKDIIMDAFQKSRGELDTDKVLSLKKHAARVPAKIKPRYDKAMSFIDKAINRPMSKQYERVWVRGADGQYKNIQLNFSSI